MRARSSGFAFFCMKLSLENGSLLLSSKPNCILFHAVIRYFIDSSDVVCVSCRCAPRPLLFEDLLGAGGDGLRPGLRNRSGRCGFHLVRYEQRFEPFRRHPVPQLPDRVRQQPFGRFDPRSGDRRPRLHLADPRQRRGHIRSRYRRLPPFRPLHGRRCLRHRPNDQGGAGPRRRDLGSRPWSRGSSATRP